MKKILVIHNKYKHEGGEDLAVQNELTLLKKNYEIKELYFKNDIKNLNKKIEEFDGEVFLFGGHIFSQFLISNGLNTNKTKYILDNSSLKQNNRLYGTSFIVKSPQILKNHKKAAVVLRAGTYSKEIKQDIINNINNKVIFF